MGYGTISQFEPRVIQPYQPPPVTIPSVSTGINLDSKLSTADTLAKAQKEAAEKAGKFGYNLDTAKFGIDALSALGGLYAGLQGVKQAKEQFNFQKDYANTNMANQIKSYNTTLGDRITSRAAQQGNMSPEQVAGYIKSNQMTR